MKQISTGLAGCGRRFEPSGICPILRFLPLQRAGSGFGCAKFFRFFAFCDAIQIKIRRNIGLRIQREVSFVYDMRSNNCRTIHRSVIAPVVIVRQHL